MALLEHGISVSDYFTAASDSGQPEGPAIFPLARLLAEPALRDRNQQMGALVEGNTDIATLAPLLPRLALIAVRFPIFRDGRGFTLARTLRERYGFPGTLRAVGHLLPDQYEYLLRCGFDQVETRPDADLAPWRAALTRYHSVSQPSLRNGPQLSGLRHALTL
jgi:uncharacterized protein (DUF934 family)